VNGVGYAAACVIAGVLAWAGVAKWQRPRGTAASFAGLGLPAPQVLARVVPLAELSVAAALVVAPRVGAVAALLLLAAFTVVLAAAVQRGAGVGCACFGSTAAASRPVSGVELVRNGGLMVLAAAALGATEPVVPALEDVILVSTAVVGGVVALAVLDLRRHVGRVWDNRLAGEAER
jgi:uncharacterized membrane protein YphA (DoxX/SURF4 family)